MFSLTGGVNRKTVLFANVLLRLLFDFDTSVLLVRFAGLISVWKTCYKLVY